MTATDTLRSVIRDLEAKAKEMELDKRLTTFADQADHYLRVAASRAGEYAAENRERVEATLDKAGSKVDEKTDGKYHAYVGKVRAGVLSGVDWVAEQRDAAESESGRGRGGRRDGIRPSHPHVGGPDGHGGRGARGRRLPRPAHDVDRRRGHRVGDDLRAGRRGRRHPHRLGRLRRLGRRHRRAAGVARPQDRGSHRPPVSR